MKSSLVKLGLFASVVFLFVMGCKRENNSLLDNNEPKKVSETYFVNTLFGNSAHLPYPENQIRGVVVDDYQNPIEGVEVKTLNESVYTDNLGRFRIFKTTSPENVTFLKLLKNGYFKFFINVQNTDFDIKVKLEKKNEVTSISAENGGNVFGLNGFLGLTFDKNSFTDNLGRIYAGNVNVTSTVILPNMPDFAHKIPGSDLRAINNTGSPVQLYSYGMVGVELNDDNGNRLNIAAGKKVKIKFPIHAEYRLSAPNEIPMWYFDEINGIWIEEGKALKKSGYFYEGEVSHFSYWNFDVPSPQAGLLGKIVDCNNNPLPYLEVNVGQSVVKTSKNGEFACLIPSGRTDLRFTIVNPYIKNDTFSYLLPPFIAGKAHNLSDTKLACGKIIAADIISCTDAPTIAEVSLIYNETRLNTQMSYLGKVQFPVPYNISSGLQLVLASAKDLIPVTTYPINEPLTQLKTNIGYYKICKTPPTNSSGLFYLTDSINDEMEYENQMYKKITSATAKYIESENKTIIEFYNDSVLINFEKHAPYGKIELNGKGKGIYSLKINPEQSFFYSPNENYFQFLGISVDDNIKRTYWGHFYSIDGTVEILEWGSYGDKVKLKINATFYREFSNGGGGKYFLGNHSLSNFTFDATRLMDKEK